MASTGADQRGAKPRTHCKVRAGGDALFARVKAGERVSEPTKTAPASTGRSGPQPSKIGDRPPADDDAVRVLEVIWLVRIVIACILVLFVIVFIVGRLHPVSCTGIGCN